MFTDTYKTIADFVLAGSNACRPKKGGNVRRAIYMALATSPIAACVGSPSTPPQYYPALSSQTPGHAFPIGGYQEDPTPVDGSKIDLPQNRDKYLKDKAELLAALDACAKNLTTCDPHVRPFLNVLELAQKVPDTLTKMEMLQTYFNTFTYDDAEIGSINIHDHSLKEALDLNRAICDEIARLKMFGAEYLKLPESSIRYVSENLYTPNGEFVGSHAVMDAKIGNKVWAISLGGYPIDASNLSGKQAEILTILLSEIEEASAQLDMSGHSNMEYSCKRTFCPGSFCADNVFQLRRCGILQKRSP